MKKYFVLAALLLTFSSKAQMRWDRVDNNTMVHFSVGIGTGNTSGIFGKTPTQSVLF